MTGKRREQQVNVRLNATEAEDVDFIRRRGDLVTSFRLFLKLERERIESALKKVAPAITNRVDEEVCDWCEVVFDHCAQFQLSDDDGGCFIAYLCRGCLVAGVAAIDQAAAES